MVSCLCIAYSVSHTVFHNQFSSQLSHQLYVGGAGGRDMLIAVMCTFVRKVSSKKEFYSRVMKYTDMYWYSC